MYKNFNDYKKYIIFFFLDNKNYSISFNWFKILFLFNFIIYGFYGSISRDLNFIISLFSILLFFLYYFLFYKLKYIASDKIIFKKKELLIIIFFFVIFSVINFEHLSYSLYVDELAFAQYTLRLPTGFSFFFLNLSSNNFLSSIPIKYVVYFFSLCVSISLIFISYLIIKKFTFKTLLFTIIVTIFFRLILDNYSLHPPLQNIIPLFFLSLFGISNLVFKLSYVFLYSIFLFVIFIYIRKKINLSSSLLACISIGTLPNLLIISTQAEYSLWALLFYTYLYLYLSLEKKINYFRLISLGSILVLARIPILFSLFSIFVYFFYTNFKKIRDKKLFFLKNILLFICPLIIFFSFIFRDIYLGRPALDVDFSHLNFLNKFLLIYKDNFIFNQIFNIIPTWVLFFLVIAFLDKKIFFYILSFFLVSTLYYLSIDRTFWNFPKYINEFVTPFVILGFCKTIIYLSDNFNFFFKKFFYILCIIIIIMNLNNFFNLSYKKNDLSENFHKILEFNNDLEKNSYIFFKRFYNFDGLFSFLKQNNYEDSTIILGNTNGFIFPLINGYSYYDILAFNINHKPIEDFIKSFKNLKNYSDQFSYGIYDIINKNSKISRVVLIDIEERDSIFKNFINNNWFIENIYYSKVFYITIIVLKKNEY